MSESEITRTVAIEHAGEKIQVEVHVHLTPEEIDQLAQRVEQRMAQRIREQQRWQAYHHAMTIGRNV